MEPAIVVNTFEDVEECVNDTYLTLWDTIPPEEPNPFVAYICRIVRNLSLKRYRHNTADKRNKVMVRNLLYTFIYF